MTTPAKDAATTVLPSLRYRNALAMIDLPCKAFGFERNAVYAGGVVQHAQLAFGNGMIMLGSADNGDPWAEPTA